jgi:hypothetical protein
MARVLRVRRQSIGWVVSQQETGKSISYERYFKDFGAGTRRLVIKNSITTWRGGGTGVSWALLVLFILFFDKVLERSIERSLNKYVPTIHHHPEREFTTVQVPFGYIWDMGWD